MYGPGKLTTTEFNDLVKEMTEYSIFGHFIDIFVPANEAHLRVEKVMKTRGSDMLKTEGRMQDALIALEGLGYRLIKVT